MFCFVLYSRADGSNLRYNATVLFKSSVSMLTFLYSCFSNY